VGLIAGMLLHSLYIVNGLKERINCIKQIINALK